MKLHLGCGKRYLPGFFHIDIDPYPHIDLIQSIGDLSNFETESIDEIYSSHAISYYDRFEAEKVLLEWNRVLKPFGQIFLVVTDLESLIKIYESTEKDINSIIGPLFGRWAIHGSGEEEIPKYIYHKTIWDEISLSNILLKNGFLKIQKFNPQEYLFKIDPKYDDHSLAFFPHMQKSGIQVSLALQGTKINSKT
jgi:ubiquinone/menaquinone biosynthesis C-methylase UbiE